jgi:hypothetical protein
MAASTVKEFGNLKNPKKICILVSIKMIKNVALGSIFGRMVLCMKENLRMIKGK